MGGDAFGAAGEAEALGGGRFHGDAVDGDVQVGGDVLAHGRDVRRHLGLLGDDGDVDVADTVSAVAQQRDDVAQEHARVGTGVGGVGVGEEVADVAEGGGAEQGVAEGVEGHVGIAMAQQATVMGNVYSADDAPASGDEAVYVVSAAYSHVLGFGIKSAAAPGKGAPRRGLFSVFSCRRGF